MRGEFMSRVLFRAAVVVVVPIVAICCVCAVSPAAVIVTPTSTVSALGHHYRPADLTAGLSIRDAATSSNAQTPNLGTFAQSGFTATLTGQDTLVGRIAAPPGMQFVAQPIAGLTNRIEVVTDWSVPGGDFGMSPSAVTFEFEGLTGASPTRLGSGLSVSGGGGKWVRFFETFNVPSAFSFTALRIEATYNYTVSSPTSRPFTPSWFEFGMRAGGTFATVPDATLMTLQPIPEPTSTTLLALGLAGAVAQRRHTTSGRGRSGHSA
jgi:hypothetical protein